MKRESHHILLVDDDLNEQFLSQKALLSALSARSTVHLVNNGQQAIAYMIGEPPFADRVRYPFPTIVITDLNMPGGDGFHVLEFMQGNREWSVVPRILFSSSDDDDDIRTAYLLGASACHLKPIPWPDFEACMHRIVEYWTVSQVPPVDETGRLLITDSEGRTGARYPQPRGGEAMQRPSRNPGRLGGTRPLAP